MFVSVWRIQNRYKEMDVIRSLFYRYIACMHKVAMAVARERCWVKRLGCKGSRTSEILQYYKNKTIWNIFILFKYDFYLEYCVNRSILLSYVLLSYAKCLRNTLRSRIAGGGRGLKKQGEGGVSENSVKYYKRGCWNKWGEGVSFDTNDVNVSNVSFFIFKNLTL